MELEQLVKQVQHLKDERDAIEVEIKAVNEKIAAAIKSEGLSKMNVGHWSVNVAYTKRYKADIAKQLMAKKKMTDKERETLYKERDYDPAKLKVMFPKEWEQARVEDQNPTVTVREVKP